jgi:uncharacterized protein
MDGADVLRRVETPSRLGAWSYEVTDAKLARETKGNTVLQISLYSDLLSEAQGLEPQSAFVVTPGTNYTPEEYHCDAIAVTDAVVRRYPKFEGLDFEAMASRPRKVGRPKRHGG